MQGLRAEVTFDFDAESLEAAGSRLRQLADAARDVGFDLVRGEVSERVDGRTDGDWTPYGPPVE